MSTPAEHLERFRQRGIELWVDQGQLHYRSTAGTLGAQELAQLRELKVDLVAELTRGCPEAQLRRSLEVTRVPLTFQQRWFLPFVQERGDWSSLTSYALLLKGALDAGALRKSLATVVHHHAALRMRLVDSAEGPQQELDTDIPAEFFETVRYDGELLYYLRGRLRTLIVPHAPGGGVPPFRVWLLPLGAQEHLLVLLGSRLTLDCLSVGVILRECFELYRSATGAPSSTAPRGFPQYSDYAVWQANGDSEWHTQHGQYWAQRLGNALPICWPLIPTTPRNTALLFARQETSLGTLLSAQIRAAAKHLRTLPAMLMLTAFVGALRRACGQTDFVLPFSIAGRHAEHERMVGCFAYPLLLRIQLTGTETCLALLKAVSQEFYRAVIHQDLGRMALRYPGLLSGTFVQTLGWHPEDVPDFGAPDSPRPEEAGLRIENFRFQEAAELLTTPPSLVDIEVSLFDRMGELGALAVFRPDRLLPDSVNQLLDDLHQSARELVRDSKVPVDPTRSDHDEP